MRKSPTSRRACGRALRRFGSPREGHTGVSKSSPVFSTVLRNRTGNFFPGGSRPFSRNGTADPCSPGSGGWCASGRGACGEPRGGWTNPGCFSSGGTGRKGRSGCTAARSSGSRSEGHVMLLVVDVGNTHTVLGVYEGEKLLHHWRVWTDQQKTSDEYGILIRNLYDGSHLSSREIDAIVVSSVVPPLTPTIMDLCMRYFGITPLVVGPGVKTGISIKMDNPKEVGADRIVNAVAAYAKYKKACIVLDFGTATTFDYISPGGDYMGGVIAPGASISGEALFPHAPRLPRVEIVKPPTVIGKNTVTAMQSGIFFGYLSLVEGVIDRVRKEGRTHPTDVG